MLLLTVSALPLEGGLGGVLVACDIGRAAWLHTLGEGWRIWKRFVKAGPSQG